MEKNNLDLEQCLERASNFHGDVCTGIMIGTRMSMVGLRAIGIEDPMGKDRKNLIVFVETDRCATDAILAVTGCHPGKRTMKILDYGKMAATFINLETGRAVRVVTKEKALSTHRDGTDEAVDGGSEAERYAVMPADELFEIREVDVELRPEDMPGRPLRTVYCSVCGEKIMDMREIMDNGIVMCRPCAEGKTYWRAKR